jgi:hypothetical protein
VVLLAATAPVASVEKHQPGVLKPINLEKLNSEKDEDDPHPASDGLHFYFASNRRGKFDIFESTRIRRNQPWPAAKLVDGYVQTKGDDRSLFVTPEGRFPQFMYFATKKEPATDANFDIYVAVKQLPLAEFGAPIPLSTVCTSADELHPWLTNDARQLYFSRKTEEGWRVFVSTRKQATAAAGFTEPKALDLPVGFHHATLTPDGKTMYLQGPLAEGRWGLFRSTRSQSGWQKPEPLDSLNSAEAPTGDRSPALSRDGMFLYFASDRSGGKGGLDLYWIATAELSRK